jgi:cell division protein FtsZ
MAEINPDIETFARIKVIGVGGAGGSAVNRMVEAGITGVDFVVINTDAQALHKAKAEKTLHIGKDATRGLGAGANPSVGRQAAEESAEEIKQVLKGADMIFIAVGEGGGTGTGAAPVIAELAKAEGILVVAIVTKPFAFEGEKRRQNAENGIAELQSKVDTLITIPNDRLLQTIDRRTPLLEAFKAVDDVLRQGVKGISDLITVHGLINLDFADVKSVMSNAGTALMGIGRAEGDNRAIDAAQAAIESPLLEVSIDGARGVLFNVTGGPTMSMYEINAAAETITSAVDPSANIIFGATLDENMGEELVVTVIATGFEGDYFGSRHKAVINAEVPVADHQYQPQTASGLSSRVTAVDDDEEDDSTELVDELNSLGDEDDIKPLGQEAFNPREEESNSPKNVWAEDVEEDADIYDKPAFLRFRRKKKED